jgi:hypothetical protein
LENQYNDFELIPGTVAKKGKIKIMCLKFAASMTQEVLSWQFPLKVYKALKYRGDGVLSSLYFDLVWKPGINASSRITIDAPTKSTRLPCPPDTKSPCRPAIYEQGFHAWLKKQDAESCSMRETSYTGCVHVVVELIAQREDFVVAGVDGNTEKPTALFNRLELTQEEYERALKAGAVAGVVWRGVDEDEGDWEEDEEDDWEGWEDEDDDDDDWEDEEDDDDDDWEDEEDDDDDDWGDDCDEEEEDWNNDREEEDE